MMTAYEYMKKQKLKHQDNLNRCLKKNAPEFEIQNVKNKIAYYEKALKALEKQIPKKLRVDDDPELPNQRFCSHNGCDWNNENHFCSYGERKNDKE